MLKTPGVYFLFGYDDASGEPFVYVGEADDTLKRLGQPHVFENNGCFWLEAVAFVDAGGLLDKAKVKYLEHRFYTSVGHRKGARL